MSWDERAITVIAHRGASAQAPELSIEAFDLALAQDADVLEVDVRLTSDGEPVLFHDETLLRLLGDRRPVAAVSFSELLDLDGQALRLDDVLARYGADTRYLIDLKCPGAVVEHAVWRAVEAHGLEDAVTIQAFCPYGLRRVRRLDAGVRLAQLYEAGVTSETIRRRLPRLARFAHAIGPAAEAVDAALVHAAHRHGLRVQPWTVNDPAEMEGLLALGVDGLITDVPDIARAALRSQGEAAVAA